MAELSLDQRKAVAMASARARAAGAMSAGSPNPKQVPDSEGALAGDRNASEGGVMDTLRGVPGAILAMGSAIPAGIAGRVSELVVPGSGETVTRAMTYQPSERGQETLRQFSNVMDKTKLEGLGPMNELSAMSATPARQVATKEADALKSLPGKAADLVTPKPSPEILKLAKKAEDLGIELRPDMLADNRIAKFIGEALEQVPLSGSKAEQRQIAFNGALIKIIGSDEKAKRLTPDVFDRAMTKSGEKIGEISKDTPIALPGDFATSLGEFTKKVGQFETADTARIINNRVQQIIDASREAGGIIPGEKFRKINSEIGAQARRAQGDLKHALGELQEVLHDALEAQIKDPSRLEELKEARYRYAMGKIIEPLVAKAKGGDISPQALMGVMTSDANKKTMMARGRGGELGDLARIGQAFLKEPPSGGTGERLGAYSLLTGGIVTEPHTAAGIVAAANAYNRLGPRLTKRAINMRSVDPAASQPQNYLLPTP